MRFVRAACVSLGVVFASSCSSSPATVACLDEKCAAADAGRATDAGSLDSGRARDAGRFDASEADAGEADAGEADAGETCGDAGIPPDFQTDDRNCGRCGNVCPAPVNATAKCVAGECRRGACSAGRFDFDGDHTFGCETTCSGRTCTGPSGTPTTLTNPPLHESGLVWNAPASGSSYGGFVQTNDAHTNVGILGESTPPVVGGIRETSNARHRNIGGFTARGTE